MQSKKSIVVAKNSPKINLNGVTPTKSNSIELVANSTNNNDETQVY